MNRLYTIAIASAVAISATAQELPCQHRHLASESPIRQITAKISESPENIPVRPLRDVPGMKSASSVINPASLRHRAPENNAVLPEGVAFFESFEGSDGSDFAWVPDGWTRDIKNETPDMSPLNKWFQYDPSRSGALTAADGRFTMTIFPSSDKQDAWLVTPEINVEDGMNLSFHAYYQPYYFFDTSEGKVDYDKSEFIGEPTIINTLMVMIQAEDGEWEEVLDVSDSYADMTMLELLENNPTEMVSHTVSLAAYSGKKIKIAFRYINNDEADTIFLDAVTIGMPPLDKVSYNLPWETLFWGYDRQPGWGYFPAAVAQYPVYSPITWTNMSPYDSKATTYTWAYNVNPSTDEWATSNDPDKLTVTYTPNYTNEATTRNNLYYPPVLTASAPGAATGTFKPSYSFFQAGGEAIVTFTDEDPTKLGLLPFSPETDGLGFIGRELVWGEPRVPYCGASEFTDLVWFNETFPGEDPSAGNYSTFVDGVLNFIYPSSSPLVIDGAHLLAYSRHQPDAELTIEIYYLNEDYILDLNTEESARQLMATATCKASDFILSEGPEYADLATIPFNFDKPVIIDNSHTAYAVLVRGFHSGKFSYFADMQSRSPHPDNMNFSYILKHNYANREWKISLFPLSYIEGEDGPCYNSFAINLLATYPYLKSDVTEVTIPNDGTTVTVPLDSYYPAEELSISSIAGLEASVSGRYGETVLTLSHNDADVIVEGNLEIKAPGVSHVIKVSEGTSSITDITTDTADRQIEAVYNMSGVRVDPSSLMPGIYIARLTDGTTRKIAVK